MKFKMKERLNMSSCNKALFKDCYKPPPDT